MTAEKSGKDGREGWGYNKLSEVGVSQLPAVTETWHYKYAQIEAVTGCLCGRLRFHEFTLLSGNRSPVCYSNKTLRIRPHSFTYTRVYFYSADRATLISCNINHVIFPGKPYWPLSPSTRSHLPVPRRIHLPIDPSNGEYGLFYICFSMLDTVLGDGGWWMDRVWNR
jgi:hypothetical protein